MRFLSAMLALAVCFATLPIGSARAAPPPRVEAYRCAQLAPAVGPRNVWQTRFSGQRLDLFDYVHRLIAAPCFQTQAACKAWLYWAQSDYPRHNSFRRCRRGLGY